MKKIKTPVKQKKATPVSTVEYATTLIEIKKQIAQAQIKATLAANKELIKLYWSIGKIVSEKQTEESWGSKVIEKLAQDIQNSFPGIAGFSRANIFRMTAFYASYEIVAQPARQFDALPIFNIPWFHNVILMQKIKASDDRLWYAQKVLDNGWSRTVLEMQIESGLHKRTGKALTNFKHTLPSPHSDIAQQTLKDPYIFDFLTLSSEHSEREIELGLIDHIQKFLLELGQGFAFVGRQVHLNIEETDYYIDMLFYHLKLNCYVVIELKARDFDPRDTGQISFYLSAVDDTMRRPHDNPSIGLLLYRSKNKKTLTIEYALRKNIGPIGVANYEVKLVDTLPKSFKDSLPSVADIEAELEKQDTLAKLRKKRMTRVKKK